MRSVLFKFIYKKNKLNQDLRSFINILFKCLLCVIGLLQIVAFGVIFIKLKDILNILLGMILSFQSRNQSFKNFTISNIIGSEIQWIFLYSENILFSKMFLINVKVYASSIIELLFSSMSIFSSEISYFYPEFLYSSLSNLLVQNCFFHDSYIQDKTKSFQVIAIFLENYNSFFIANTVFDSLTNEIYGPVNFCYN